MSLKNESKTRYDLMEHYAKRIGAEKDLQNLFDKWDRAIALAPESEKKDMARAAILEVQFLLDIHGEDGLTINGEVIMPTMDQKII